MTMFGGIRIKVGIVIMVLVMIFTALIFMGFIQCSSASVQSDMVKCVSDGIMRALWLK